MNKQDIKIIRQPRVYVLARPKMDQAELDRFLADNNIAWVTDTEIGAEKLVETAGRICYMSFARPRPGGNKTYIDNIINSGHGSVCEHATWSLLITGVSRTLTHELVRHRAGAAYSQLSQRYVDESVAEYVEPDVIADRPHLHVLWLDAMDYAHRAYMALAKELQQAAPAEMTPTDQRKWARQAARSVLPNATETKIVVTCNARAWRHIIELRGSRHAEPEIRRLAVIILGVLQKESPVLFGDYTLVALPDGSMETQTAHRKV